MHSGLLRKHAVEKFLFHHPKQETKSEMNRRFATLTLAALVLACVCLATAALAQDDAATKPRAMYLAVPPHSYYPVEPSTSHLTQWTYHFTYQGTKYTPTIVGTDATKTNTSTTTPVFIIPIKMVYGKTNGNHTFDPNKDIYPGTKLTVTQYIAQSPLFVPINFTEGRVNLGTTQYEDAYERGSFWKYVSKNSGYHVLLAKPTILPEKTINVSPSEGSIQQNPFGKGKVGFYGNGLSIDPQLQTWIHELKQIQPDSLPLFLVYDVYLGCGTGCAIGGYHSAVSGQPNGQTYSFSTTIDPDAFASSTGALSHEFGEWLLDPFIDNPGCGGLMENGDPLETEANYGLYPYKGGNGSTYQLQDLVFINYFGAPRNTSLKSWFTFRDETNVTAPCDRGQD
jgi:hypothetical protein